MPRRFVVRDGSAALHGRLVAVARRERANRRDRRLDDAARLHARGGGGGCCRQLESPSKRPLGMLAPESQRRAVPPVRKAVIQRQLAANARQRRRRRRRRGRWRLLRRRRRHFWRHGGARWPGRLSRRRRGALSRVLKHSQQLAHARARRGTSTFALAIGCALQWELPCLQGERRGRGESRALRRRVGDVESKAGLHQRWRCPWHGQAQSEAAGLARVEAYSPGNLHPKDGVEPRQARRRSRHEPGRNAQEELHALRS